MNQKNCLILHGCPGDEDRAMNPATRTYDKHWLPWIKRELTAKGIPSEITLMPTPWDPSYERFRAAFEKYTVTENTILIGTSCGCSFLIRWLGETKKKILKLILVAPWKFGAEDDPKHVDFYVFPIDPSIKDRVKEITFFTADNESFDGKEGLKMFHAILGGAIINLKGHGHYVMADMGTEQFPELLAVALK